MRSAGDRKVLAIYTAVAYDSEELTNTMSVSWEVEIAADSGEKGLVVVSFYTPEAATLLNER